LKIGQIVYHRDVYEHKEPLKIIGIKENELELEGDYSGGTHNVIQSQWMPLKGVSLIRDYAYKVRCREEVLKLGTIESGNIIKLADMVLHFTRQVEYNKEF